MKPSRVAVIDYGLCNIDSVLRAVQECGGSPILAADPAGIADATHVILPGVGSFHDAMRNLHTRKLVPVLNDAVVAKRTPFLGICLGMQLLASTGEEGGKTEGLGWIPGEVCKLSPRSDERIPHVGWNEVHHGRTSPIFDGIETGKDFYFIHSYHFVVADAGHAIATTPYCGGFVSAVNIGNIFGTQFHPEKSQKPGCRVLRNFLSLSC